MTTNNLNPIASKYWTALTAIRGATEPQDDRAILLALQLAVDEAARTTPATTQRQPNPDRQRGAQDELAPNPNRQEGAQDELAPNPNRQEEAQHQVARLQTLLAHADAANTSYASQLATATARLVQVVAERDAAQHDLATATAERNYSEGQLATLTAWLRAHDLANDERNEVDIAISLLRSQATELDAIRQQLAQLDADNAALTQEIATLRSYVVAPSGRLPLAPVIANPPATPTPMPAAIELSQDAADYQAGLDAGRWTWRQVPRRIRLDLVRHTISRLPAPTQAEFDAHRPTWMPSAASHSQTFGVSWSQLTNPTHEIEVPA